MCTPGPVGSAFQGEACSNPEGSACVPTPHAQHTERCWCARIHASRPCRHHLRAGLMVSASGQEVPGPFPGCVSRQGRAAAPGQCQQSEQDGLARHGGSFLCPTCRWILKQLGPLKQRIQVGEQCLGSPSPLLALEKLPCHGLCRESQRLPKAGQRGPFIWAFLNPAASV